MALQEAAEVGWLGSASTRPISIVTHAGTANCPPSLAAWTDTVSAANVIKLCMQAYMVHLFEDAYLCSIHAKRVTLFGAWLLAWVVLNCKTKTYGWVLLAAQ
eukprot:COSAG01_NODE_10051_length_2262_cov_2.056403_4_plen_102_part_00